MFLPGILESDSLEHHVEDWLSFRFVELFQCFVQDVLRQQSPIVYFRIDYRTEIAQVHLKDWKAVISIQFTHIHRLKYIFGILPIVYTL